MIGAAALVAGCGSSGDGGPDGGDAAGPSDPYDQPSDFVRLDCVPGSLAAFDPTGIWHLDVRLAGVGNLPVVHRYGDGAWLNGRMADVVELSDDDLFTRVAFERRDETLVRTYDACALREDGTLFGRVAFCSGDTPCYVGEFTAVKVERRPGEAEAEGLELVSEWAGDPAAPWGEGTPVNVRVVDGVAYLAAYEDGLRIIDVADAAAPRDLGWSPVHDVEAGELYNDVKVVDRPDGHRFALMASDTRGVVSIDVTDPGSPVEVAAFPAPPEGEVYTDVHTLFTEQVGARTIAYLANVSTIGLDVFDVTDPAAPVLLGSFVHPDVEDDPGAYLHDLYVENGRAYLNYWTLGLVIVDTQPDPAQPLLVGSYEDYERRTNHSNWVTTTSSGAKVSVMGDEDYGAHVRIVDVDPESATFLEALGEFSLRPEVSVHNIMAFGDRAYVAWYQDGLRILDLSDPAAPTQVAYFNTWDGRTGASFFEGAVGLDVDLAAGIVYVADSERGLLVLRELP